MIKLVTSGRVTAYVSDHGSQGMNLNFIFAEIIYSLMRSTRKATGNPYPFSVH
jgi:hypothetical protein